MTSATSRWPLPDFVVRPARPPALAWIALLFSGVVFAFSVDDWIAVAQRRADVAIARARVEMSAPPVAAVASPLRLDPRAVRDAAVVAQRLDYPWQAVFETTERNAASTVHWLRLSADAARGELRLGGEASDREALRATLDALAAAPALREVMLVRVETAPAPMSGLRFEVRAVRAGVEASR